MERHEVLVMSRVHARGAHDDGAEARRHARRLRRHPRHMYAEGGSSAVIRCSRSSVRCCRSRSPTRRHAPSSTRWRPPSCQRPAALADFDFAASPVNEPLIQELAGGGFLEGKRNIVLVGGTGTGKDPSRRRHRALLHPKGCTRPLLQRRRPGQPPRGRDPRRTPGPHRRPARPPRPRHPRRARLPALRSGRRAAALPPHEPALRANLDRHHHKPRLR